MQHVHVCQQVKTRVVAEGGQKHRPAQVVASRVGAEIAHHDGMEARHAPRREDEHVQSADWDENPFARSQLVPYVINLSSQTTLQITVSVPRHNWYLNQI